MFKIKNNEDGGITYYTLDGSEPDENSFKYDGEITLNKQSIIKARTFKEGFKPSEIVEGFLYETIKIKDIKGLTNPVQIESYNKNGVYDLIDGIKGSKDYRDGSWLGYHEDMDVIIDLGEVKEISEVSVGFLQDTRAWIYYPRYVDFKISLDSKEFKKLGRKEHNNLINRKEIGVENISIKLNERCRYIRIFAKNEEVCPKWSIMANEGPAFMFVDQITVI